MEFWSRVRRPGGKRVMRRIGNFGDTTLEKARETAQEWHGIKVSRKDVVQVLDEREREALTVAEVVREYLWDFRKRVDTRTRRGKSSSYVEAERILTKRIAPKLGGIPVRSLTAEPAADAIADAIALALRLADKGKVVAITSTERA